MKWLINLFLTLSLLGVPSYSFAKTYAYFIGMGRKIAKLDTDTNTVTANLKIKEGAVLGTDRINNYLYVSHCIRLGNCTVGIYSLKTLTFIKELPLESAPGEAIHMLVYPDGSRFLIQYFDPGDEGEEGGYSTDLYDAKTLNRIQNLQTMFAMKRVIFSADGKKIYTVIGGDEARVDIINSSTFQVLASRDLMQIRRQDVFSSGIESYGSGKILIFENLQAGPDLPSKLDLYVYDIETQTISPKISTGLQGDATLTADGTRIIFDENEDIRKIKGSESYLMGFNSLGRMHIYDVSTGKELRMISFKVQGRGKIKGIRPAGDRLYYQSEGLTKDTSNITVIDIKSYYVVTTIALPFKVLSVVFFEE